MSTLRQEVAAATSAEQRKAIAARLAAIASADNDAATHFARVVRATITRLDGDAVAALRILDSESVATARGPKELVEIVRAQESVERVQTLVLLGHEDRATEVARQTLEIARRLGGDWPLTACTVYAEAMSARGFQAQVEAFCAEVIRQESARSRDRKLLVHLAARVAIAQSSTWINQQRDLRELAGRLDTMLADSALLGLRPALLRRSILVHIEAGDHERAAELAERELATLGGAPRETLRFTGFRARAKLLASGRKPGADAAADLARERDALARALDAFLTQVRGEPATETGVAWFHYAELRDAVAVLLDLECACESPALAAARCSRHLFAVHSIGSLTRLLSNEPGNVESFRSTEIAADEIVLLYWLAPHRSFVVGIDLESTWVEILESDRVQRTTLDRARSALDEPRRRGEESADQARFATAASELASWLLPPTVARVVQAHAAVTILGGDAAMTTPFEALPFAGTRLGLGKRVRYLASAGLAAALRKRLPLPGERSAAGPAHPCVSHVSANKECGTTEPGARVRKGPISSDVFSRLDRARWLEKVYSSTNYDVYRFLWKPIEK